MKKQFFRSKFIMFLSLTLVPICIFGFVSVFYINLQLQKEAREKTTNTTQLMAQNMNELTSTLEYYKVSLSSDAKFHLALIRALDDHANPSDDMSRLAQTIQGLYYSLSTKPYIHSLYLTMKGSSYYIDGISRVAFETSNDSTWTGNAFEQNVSPFIKTREIKKNKFDTRTAPVVTVYNKLKYNELMALNLDPNYFDNWLNSITAYNNQALVITDSNGQILFCNDNTAKLPEKILQQIDEISDHSFTDDSTIDDYFYNAGTFPGVYGFRYLSLIPRAEVFGLCNSILNLTIAAGLLSILLSSLLAYFYTARDYRQIFQIIDVFDQAEKGTFKPIEQVNIPNHAYFHIINNIINLFMSQTYLKVQLDAKKYALSTAQLSALQYQLNPHFLFNTLQSIDLEILKHTKKPVAANHMISSLSELLRYSLEQPRKPVTLREEIAATQNYINLQTWRLGEAFGVEWEYSEDILNCPMLRLLLQPIIENSIIHSQHETPEDLKIKIRIRKNQNGLAVTVIDNGLGITHRRLEELKKQLHEDQVDASGRHIGLKNISQRVRLAYENGYIRLWSKEGMGTIVIIGGISGIPLTLD